MASKRVREAEELRRRKAARQRFRNIIRSVMFNRVWLMADSGDQKLSLNVKRNISMLVRQQRKIGMLTMAEKALLRCHHSMRTIEDRKKLVMLLAGLACFSKIPPKVCARLVPVIKCIIVECNIVIMREGDIPIAVYFILSGEVEVTKKVFDHATNSYVERVECISGPGDCIGDIEFVEKCRRRNTYTATNVVEMLVLQEDDFEELLYPVMSKQWLDKKRALLALGYFDALSEEQIINACKISQIRQFEPLETIYYEDKGHASYVHYVISGECIILQCLKMKVTQKKGNTVFDLVDISKENGDTMFQDISGQDMLKQLKAEETHGKSVPYDIDQELASDEEGEPKETTVTRASMGASLKKVEISCGLRQPSAEELPTEQAQLDENAEQSEGVLEEEEAIADMDETEIGQSEAEIGTDLAGLEELREATEELPNTEADQVAELMEPIKSPRQSRLPSRLTAGAELNEATSEKGMETAAEPTAEPTKQSISAAPATEQAQPERSQRVTIEETDALAVGEDGNSELDATKPLSNEVLVETVGVQPKEKRQSTRIENRFIDVGSMTFGGIFGLGEKIEHRVIMARTTVQCLMLPRFWLFEKDQNPGNIWQRRRFYLDSTIPSRQSLFKDFLTTRRWQKFKKDLIDSSVEESHSNPTKVQDVPIICRIVEANDD